MTGAGRAFSAGGDVNWFKRGLEESGEYLSADVRRGADVLHQAIVDFRRIPYPVIGAINGVAAGAGFSLALMCDTRIASEDAAFVCAYGRIGASPDGGHDLLPAQVVGPARGRCELLLNDPHPERRAGPGGWASWPRWCPAMSSWHRPASGEDRDRGAWRPTTCGCRSSSFGQSLENSLADHLQLERHGIADSMATEDLREGVTAFLDGREAEFQGAEHARIRRSGSDAFEPGPEAPVYTHARLSAKYRRDR